MRSPILSQAGRAPALPPVRWRRREHAVARANALALVRARLLPVVGMGLSALMLALLVVWFRQVAVPFDCRPARVPLRLNSQADAALKATRGAPCSVVVDTGSASVDALSIETAPANGTLRPRGRTGVVYRAAPSFTGEDDFTIALKGRANQTPGTMQVRVRVVVE
jgi:hypothetical protein